eukprot:GHVU01087076.1.p1 GENE.GHVU01087076.1~~GHVU01087076.1.p1  ORF type:complete len:294 (-),score=16.87 GHVU01087076.1:1836-2717(-)
MIGEDLTATMEAYLASPMVKSFLAGSLSGTFSTILFQPLDLVKTRLQNSIYVGARPPGVIAVLGHVIRSEHLLALWKGVVPSLTRTVPGIGVYFCSLHTLRSNFGNADPSPLESMAMGALARSVSGMALLPFTVIKTRFESGMYDYKTMRGALVTIYKLEGTKGLYSGMAATLLRDAPFSGLYLMFYTQTKKFIRSLGWCENLTPVMYFSCGVFAGAVASVVTQPADVVKTRMQLNPTKFNTIKGVVMFIYERDGSAGFLRGLVPRTVRRTLMAAVAWTIYEQIMQSIGMIIT